MLWPYQGGTHNARPGAWAIGLGTLLQDGITVEGGVTVCQEVATQTQGSVGDGKIAGRSIGQIPKSRTDQIMRTLKVCINKLDYYPYIANTLKLTGATVWPSSSCSNKNCHSWHHRRTRLFNERATSSTPPSITRSDYIAPRWNWIWNRQWRRRCHCPRGPHDVCPPRNGARTYGNRGILAYILPFIRTSK